MSDLVKALDARRQQNIQGSEDVSYNLAIGAAKEVVISELSAQRSAILGTFGPLTCADVGKHLSCGEVDVLADLFRFVGAYEAADLLIEMHGRSDEPGEPHYQEGAS